MLMNWPHIMLVDALATDSLTETSNQTLEYVARVAFKKSQFLIIDFARRYHASKDEDLQQFGRLMACIHEGLKRAVAHGGNLEHIIIAGGRLCPELYFALIKMLELGRAQRPLQLSFIDCSLVRTVGQPIVMVPNFDLWYQHFWKEQREIPMLKTTIRCPPKTEDVLLRRFLPMISKSLFPYKLTQIEWMESFLHTVINQENGGFVGPLFIFWLVGYDSQLLLQPQILKSSFVCSRITLLRNGTFMKNYCRKMDFGQSAAQMDIQFASDAIERVEQMAVALWSFARMATWTFFIGARLVHTVLITGRRPFSCYRFS